MTGRNVPETISTRCPELDRAWATFAHRVLNDEGILIPDTDEDLTWHAFLGHSIDMQGWRAAEFVGVDDLTRDAPDFVPLKSRGIGVPELAQLWLSSEIRDYLLFRTAGAPVSETLRVLRTWGGDIGASFADAYDAFPWRKAHMAVRAYLQNSAALRNHEYSFRRWLEDECRALGVASFPPPDFRMAAQYGREQLTVEWALVRRLEESFYQVGPTMAPYMICDWQLWLWNQKRTAVFEAYKPDEFHVQFVNRYGKGIVPSRRSDFIDWWLAMYPTVPPRLVNECIWLAVETGLL